MARAKSKVKRGPKAHRPQPQAISPDFESGAPEAVQEPVTAETPQRIAVPPQHIGAKPLRIQIGLVIDSRATLPTGHVSPYVDVRLDRKQATAMKRICAAMDADHVRLRDGKLVRKSADVVRYLVEQAEDCLNAHLTKGRAEA